MGQQARDAMLLCMSLSKKNDEVGLYIADHSNICPVSNLMNIQSEMYQQKEWQAFVRVKVTKCICSINVFFYLCLGISYRIEWTLFGASKKAWYRNGRLASIDAGWCKWITRPYTTHEFSGILQRGCPSSASNGAETVAWIFISRFFNTCHGSSFVTGKCL